MDKIDETRAILKIERLLRHAVEYHKKADINIKRLQIALRQRRRKIRDE